MTIEIDVNDEFGRFVVSGAAEKPPTEPRVFYNSDGDCIEFLLTDQSYYAERVDSLLTVYYGRQTGEIVGSLIKGVRKFIEDVLLTSPGFAIEVEDGKIRLGHLFTAHIWKQDQPNAIVVKTYKKLRESAIEHGIQVEVPAPL